MKKSIFTIIAIGCLIINGFAAAALDNPSLQVTKVITQYITAKYPNYINCRLKVSLLYADKTLADLAKEKGEVKLEIVETYKNLKPLGTVIFPVKVTTGPKNTMVFIKAKVEVFKNIVVAKTLLHKGDALYPANLMLAERDIALLPPDFFTSLDSFVNQEITTTVPAKSTLYKWMVKDIPDIKRGKTLTVYIVGPSLLVQTTGTALEDGYLNKNIKIKTAKAKEALDGILLSSTEVEVKLK